MRRLPATTSLREAPLLLRPVLPLSLLVMSLMKASKRCCCCLLDLLLPL
jgi:hypothetical protein